MIYANTKNVLVQMISTGGTSSLYLNQYNHKHGFNHKCKTMTPTKYFSMRGLSNSVTSLDATTSTGGGWDVFNVVVEHDDWGGNVVPQAHSFRSSDYQRDFKTKKGYRIIINADGDYEIEAPEGLVLEDHLRLHPNGKILDGKGNVLEITGGIITGYEALMNASGRFIDIKDPVVNIRDTLLANSFGRIAVPVDGCRLILPDDVELIVRRNGSYEINETRKSFTYKAAPRDFNKFLNASDVVEDFIRFLGSCDVKQKHVMQMPLGLFLNWLVIQAAKADGESWEDIEPPLLEGVKAVKAQPRCKFCKRFISHARADAGVNFCSPRHMQGFLLRENVDRPKPRRAPLLQIAAPPSDSYFGIAAE